MKARRVSCAVCTLVVGFVVACKGDAPSKTAGSDTEKVQARDGSAERPLVAVARNVVDWLAHGDYASFRKTFDRGMREAFPDEAAVAKWWRGTIKQTGKLRKQFSVAERMEGSNTAVIVTAIFDLAPQDVLVLFNAEGEVAGMKVSASSNPNVRPQTPEPPFPYSAREVSYDGAQSDTKIAGTLTVPAGDGPHPAVLLISGSGLQDRDNTMSGHKSFLVIADHLSRKGIAVLRVDDRSVGGSTGDPSQETIESIATDVEAGLTFLKGQKSIDPKRIGLIGHSVGGMVAPMVAARSPDVAFVVSLNGPAVSGAELIPVQVRALLESQGAPEDVVADIVAAQTKLAPLLAADAPDSELRPAVDQLVEAAGRSLPKDANPKLREAMLMQIEKQALGRWQRSFARVDPGAYLSRVTVPILALYSEKDVVVPAAMNFDRAKQALARAHNQLARVELLPGLNHLLQKAETGAVDEYVMLTETVDPAALDLMTQWLLETVGLSS